MCVESVYITRLNEEIMTNPEGLEAQNLAIFFCQERRDPFYCNAGRTYMGKRKSEFWMREFQTPRGALAPWLISGHHNAKLFEARDQTSKLIIFIAWISREERKCCA